MKSTSGSRPVGLLCSFVRFYADTSENGYGASLEDNYNDLQQSSVLASTSIEMQQQSERRKPPLVFVLNLRDNERQTLVSTLSSWGTPTSQLPIIITSEEVPASERAALYARGGVFVITSRILIVDLLQGTAKSKDIEGMLVAHGEKVVGDKSMEAFILRIYRSQRYFMGTSSIASSSSSNTNRSGFIKAFTDDASSLVAGFAKIDKVLKSLQVQRLFLYPRFHATVAEELEVQPPTVIELHQPLSEKMKQIQQKLAASMIACIRDLRQKCPQLDLSFMSDSSGGGNDKQKKRKRGHDDFMTNYVPNKSSLNKNTDAETVRTCITTNFQYVFKQQLEGYNLSWDARQCINDLSNLSRLFQYLIEYGKLYKIRYHWVSIYMVVYKLTPSLCICM